MVQSLEIDEIAYAHKVIDLSNFFYAKLKTGDYSKNELDFYTLGYISLFRKLSIPTEQDFSLNILNNTNERTKKISEMLLETISCNVKKSTIIDVNDNLLEMLGKGLRTEITQVNFFDAIKAYLLCEEIHPFLCNKEWPISARDTLFKASKLLANDPILDTLSLFYGIRDEKAFNKLSSEILRDLEAEGIIQLAFSRMALSELEISKDVKTMLAIRLYKYVKEVAKKAELLNFFNNGFKPQSKAVRQIFFSSIILRLIGFDRSLSIPHPENLEYLDRVMETALVKRAIDKTIKENLVFNTRIILPAIGDKYNLKLSLPKIMILFLMLFSGATTLVFLLLELFYNQIYGTLFNTVFFATLLVFYMFIINALSLLFQTRRILKKLR